MRNRLRAARAYVYERAANELAAESAPFEARGDLGVEEGERTWTNAVDREAGAPASKRYLVAALGGVVPQIGLGCQ